MLQHYFYQYLPYKYMYLCQGDNRQKQVNNFVFAFKDGNKSAIIATANILINYLVNKYHRSITDYTIVFAPASSQSSYNKRFAYLATMLERRLQTPTSYHNLHIQGQRTALHNGGSHIVCEDAYNVALDESFFKGRKCIIFDDLITTGQTAAQFTDKVKSVGAEVIEELFLARTIHYNPYTFEGAIKELNNKQR